MKKIIAFALSIAVLFAFAACEAGTIPPYYGKTVESITLLSAPDYIVGETLNPADLSFRVVYDNGEEVTRTGADLGLAPTTTGTGSTVEIDSDGSYEFTNATAKTFGIKYGTSRPTSGGVVTEKAIWTCEITPYEAAKVKYVVDPSNAPKEYVAGTDPFEGVVITAKLPKGDKVVSAEIAGIDMDDFDTAVTETTVTFTVKSTVTNVTLSSAWTITYSVVEEEVTGITFEYNDELFANTPAADMTTLDKIEFKVHVTYSTGRTEDFATRAAFKSAGGEVDFNGFYDENTKVQEVSTSSINFTATVEYEDYTNPSVSLSGRYATDYPTTFTATLKSEYKDQGAKQLSAPDTVRMDMFDFAFSDWASGADDYDGPAGSSDIVIENADIIEGESGNHTVYFYWGDADLRDKVNSGDPVEVTVPIKAAE